MVACCEAKAMAVLHSWKFVLLTSAIVLTSGISEYPVAATDVEVDEKGYEVTTVLDGNKIGHSFYNIYEDTNGGPSAIALDSTKSSILRVSLPLSQSSVVERISGSSEGKPGYRDGSANEALFNHPKRLALDSDGTIYVADTKNNAVRMITRAGLVTTIAGGSNRTGHIDGEGSEVTFSNDFDVTYLRSTCTLAIADRGNRVIREIQLPQFIGRCSGVAPNSPGSTFTGAALLMSILAGIVLGGVAGVTATILTISTRRLEQLQSRLCWATTEGPSWARSSTWKKTVTPSSTLQVKGTLLTPSSVTRNAAVEELVWSPALIMEGVITLFEKFLYILLYSMSLLLWILCSQPFRKLFPKSGTTTLHNPDNETDLLGLHEQGYLQPSILRNFSLSLLPAFRMVGSVRSLLIPRQQLFQVKTFQHASPQVKDFLILGDLIDFSEPARSEGPACCRNGDSATVSGISEPTPADVVNNELTIDSMVEKCLAELAAPSPDR